MLEIKPIQSKAEQEHLCILCGVEYDADALAYSAYETEQQIFIGMTQFAIHGKCGYLYNVSCAKGVDDFEARFIMGRAAMNFIDLCGITHLYYAGDDEKTARMLGFQITSDGKFYINLTGFFESPCRHDQKTRD